MEQLRYDLRLAFRNAFHRSRVSGIIILTLAVGIACTTAMFSVVRGVLLRPLPWPDSDAMAVIWNRPAGLADPILLSQREIADLQELLPSVAVGSYSTQDVPLRLADRAETLTTTWVTREVFDMLGAETFLGRGFTAEEYVFGGPSSVLLSYQAWQRLFGGDAGVVGTSLDVGGTQREVIGVMPPERSLPLEIESGERTELWIGTTLGYARDWSRQVRMFPALARLDAGTSVEEARGELARALEELRRRHPEVYDAAWRMELVPIVDEIFGGVRPAILALFGAVFFVLMIACANVAHLLLAQNDSRRGAIAVHSALGARRTRLVRQLMLENVTLALAGGALGTLGAYLAIDLLVALEPGNLPRIDTVSLDASVLAFGLLASLATAVLFGLPPALKASRSDVLSALRRGRGTAGGLRAQRGRRLLVVGELALATVLLVGAGLLIGTLKNLADADLGFEPRGLVVAGVSAPNDRYPTPRDLLDFWDRVREQAGAQPEIEAASLTMSVPLYSSVMSRAVELERGAAGNLEVPRVTLDRAAPEIATTMGLRLLQGRDLSPTDGASATPVALINETLAKYFDDEAIGQRIRLTERPESWLTIVGVVSDVVHESVEEAAAPRLVVPYTQFPATGMRMQRFMWLALRSHARTGSAFEAARRAVHEVDPAADVLRSLAMDDHVARSAFARYRFAGTLLSLFAGVAVTLAVVGIYGLLSYLATSGRREVGVRMAVGARSADIYRLVSRQGLVLVVAGLAIGIPAAAGLTRLIDSLLYGVAATEPLTFVLTALVLLAAAAAASFLPAYQATQVDPIEVLRSE